MATTRLIVHHISNGETIAESIKGRLDYGKNPDKTRNGELISAYMCDPQTADKEFLLSKAKYRAITGREQKKDADILCYQIRQSFVPGETDPENALKIGYDLAMRWTKGKHAFLVISHTDRPHPHVHIYYNPITLDCTRKFRNFRNSAFALRRLSDRVCLEQGLSCIQHPKPHSKGKYQHYGQWLGNQKPKNFQERLTAQIDLCLSRKPETLQAFLHMMAEAGYEVKHGRGGTISFRIAGQERYTRLRSSTLGKGYGLEDIIETIASPMSNTNTNYKASSKINLIIDIQSRMRTGKGPAYENWAKIFNLKMMAATLQYLQEQDLLAYDQLEQRAITFTEQFHTLSDQIKTIETAQHRNAELKKAIVQYARTRPVFEAYKEKKYSRNYLADHTAEIELHRAAQATFKRVLAGVKLPKMNDLKQESETLAKQKRVLYQQYKSVKQNMQDIITAKANIDALFGITAGQKNKEMER